MAMLPLFNGILCFWTSVGNFTSVVNPTAWRNLITYQVMSNCHHSRPCRAENSKAWWLLCHPSPNASNATHLKTCRYFIRNLLANQLTRTRCILVREVNGTNCSWTDHQYSMLASLRHDMLNVRYWLKFYWGISLDSGDILLVGNYLVIKCIYGYILNR